MVGVLQRKLLFIMMMLMTVLIMVAVKHHPAHKQQLMRHWLGRRRALTQGTTATSGRGQLMMAAGLLSTHTLTCYKTLIAAHSSTLRTGRAPALRLLLFAQARAAIGIMEQAC